MQPPASAEHLLPDMRASRHRLQSIDEATAASVDNHSLDTYDRSPRLEKMLQ